jgi:hypothetical protein
MMDDDDNIYYIILLSKKGSFNGIDITNYFVLLQERADSERNSVLFEKRQTDTQKKK